MFKRVGLFLLTNLLIIATISIITNVLGVGKYLDGTGLNLTALLAFCLIWGMTGAFISLLLSKVMVKWTLGVRIITGKEGQVENEIVSMVRRLSQTANIPMPEVGIYESPEINAFATGPSKSSSLVAVSSGLLQNMSSDEVEGVLGHEIAHVANGDMVTMTLIQGVVNSFAMFLSRIISFAVSQFVKEELASLVRIVMTIILDIVFTILGSLVVAYFSRKREFRADYGGAKFAGRNNMISALERLKRTMDAPEDDRATAIASLKISGKKGWMSLFSTHPPLEERIAALKGAHIQ